MRHFSSFFFLFNYVCFLQREREQKKCPDIAVQSVGCRFVRIEEEEKKKKLRDLSKYATSSKYRHEGKRERGKNRLTMITNLTEK